MVAAMHHVQALRGGPQQIQVDNGSEFISVALDQWAYERGVTLDFSQPGKPTDNAFIESFNGSLRDECGFCRWTTRVRRSSAGGRITTKFRPHSSLGDQTPNEFRRAHLETGNL
ncbi:integrase core domain-containing protein [Chromobacterium vaccinii]|uniref:integrase core domain-containing protein n=1 Tax=Chromobacterium vaccinii TaxID=1108595 RepID=UPI003C79081C